MGEKWWGHGWSTGVYVESNNRFDNISEYFETFNGMISKQSNT